MRNDGAWSNRPNLNGNGSDAWLNGNYATNANGDFGLAEAGRLGPMLDSYLGYLGHASARKTADRLRIDCPPRPKGL